MPKVGRILACILLALPLQVAAQLPPPPPSCMPGLAATPGDGSVTLDWPPANASGITGYKVLFRPAGGDWFPVDLPVGADATTYVDEGAVPGTTYTYAVVALRGDSAYDTYCSTNATATGSRSVPRILPATQGASPQTMLSPGIIAVAVGAAALLGVSAVVLGRKR